jgi:1-acyl-sn-glycerol-3-phosphate acyltransferase
MEFPYTPVIGLARTVFFLQGLRFTIVGEENVPTVGGAVMAINHTGYFDFTYAGWAPGAAVASCGSWPRSRSSATR